MADSIELRVKRISFEADTINAYELVSPDGSELPAFTAGSHIDLHLANGMVRSYSLVNDQSERHRYVVAINKDAASRGGSGLIHDTIRVGDRLCISPPRNNFVLYEEAEHSVFIAGGIGITPMMSMIRRLMALGRPWELHYAARTKASAAFLDELKAMAPDVQQHIHVDFDDARGGRVFDLAAIVGKAPADAHMYCCGPAPMLKAFEAAAAGRPADHVHTEYFQAQQAPALEGGFEVELARSKKTLTVAPGKTILDTVLEAGVFANYSCHDGVCGTCETRVIEGIPDHRDEFLSADEKAANSSIMICCSGAKSSKLVLDM